MSEDCAEIEELVAYTNTPAHRFAPFRRAFPADWEWFWTNSRLGDMNIITKEMVEGMTPDLVTVDHMTSIYGKAYRDSWFEKKPGLREQCMGPGADEFDEKADWKYALRRVVLKGRASNKALRIPPSVRVIAVEDVYVTAAGVPSVQDSDLMGWSRKSGYFPIRMRGRPAGAFAGQLASWANTRAKHVTAELCVAFAMQYEWIVTIGNVGCGSIILPTRPELLVDLFRTRDVPSGKKRRDAVLNWVRSHTRRVREEPEALVEVRRHLRGAHSFVWDGFEVTVKPSAGELGSFDPNPSKKVRDVAAIPG